MSGDPQEQKDPRDHDCEVERAKPTTRDSGRVWNWSWQAHTHARDETVLLCAAGGDGGGGGGYSPSVASPFTRLVVCLQCVNSSSSFSFSSSLSSSVAADSSSSLTLSTSVLLLFCGTLQSCRWWASPRALPCWWATVDFLCLRCWLALTLSLSLYLALSHGFLLPIYSQSLQSSLASPLPLPLSLSLSLWLHHSHHTADSQGMELQN